MPGRRSKWMCIKPVLRNPDTTEPLDRIRYSGVACLRAAEAIALVPAPRTKEGNSRFHCPTIACSSKWSLIRGRSAERKVKVKWIAISDGRNKQSQQKRPDRSPRSLYLVYTRVVLPQNGSNLGGSAVPG